MRGNKRATGLLLAALTMLSAAASSGETQTGFADGHSEELLVFPPGGGENSSVSIELPAGVEIMNASLDLEGRRGLNGSSNYSADFLLPRGSTAWAGNLTIVPPVLPPAGYEDLNITIVPGIKHSDNIRYYTSATYSAPYHLFEFELGNENITEFNLTWEGVGMTMPEIGFGDNGAILYLWNRIMHGWDMMDIDGMGEVSIEVYLTANISINPSRYIDVTGRLAAFACPKRIQYLNDIETDYVSVRYTAWGTSYPQNVSMDVGADGSVEWNRSGPLDRKETFTGMAFSSALQKAVDNATGNTTRVQLKLASSSGGLLSLSNLSVGYRQKDLPPSLSRTVPTVVMQEDLASFGALDLAGYFDDDGGAGNLTFSLSWLDNGDKLRAEINGTNLDLLPAKPDWWGDARARLRAADVKGQWADSNDFVVRVAPVNDAPGLERVGDLTASEGVPFEHAFNATDPDDQALSFSTNSTLFSLDAATGRIAFTPDNKDVGMRLFWIKVADDEGASDVMVVGLDVLNRNDPPVLEPIGDRTAVEHARFSLALRFSDPDMEIGADSLHFICEPALFDISGDGVLSFTPQENDVGTRVVYVSVVDSGGLRDTKDFLLKVLNVNDPPRVRRPDDMTVYEDRPASFRINATDPDAGDSLTFSSAAGLFTIAPDGQASFTPAQNHVGTHLVQVTVTDRAGARDSVSFNITVLNVNDPPVDVRIISPEPGSAFAEGGPLPLRVLLKGTAHDEDGDSLNYTWYLDGRAVAWTQNSSIEKVAPGKHTLTLGASDGQSRASSSPVDFTVKGAEPQSDFPWGLMMVLFLAALAVLVTIAFIIIKRGPTG